jgi:serpin B
MLKFLPLVAVLLSIGFTMSIQAFAAGTPSPGQIAADAINSLGIDLMHTTARANANALISPYSVETALVMTYAGADGKTRAEMQRVLHLPDDDAQTHRSFAALQRDLDAVVQQSAERSAQMKSYGRTNDTITLAVANRLFGQQGYDFKPAFLDLLKTNYNAPFEAMDFVHDARGATKTINDWVAEETRQRIQNLIPEGALDEMTRLVLANAVYFKAPWEFPFSESATTPQAFHANGGDAVNVPTMSIQKSFGYAKENGLTVLSLPYNGGELQFLIILPDEVNGLAKAETDLKASQLAEWSKLPARDVKLFLPKFKIAPPTLPLGEALQTLGMTTAFDKPRGSANFDRMAPRRPPNDYLYISRVLHKTFLDLDEKGTEAAAATAVVMVARSAVFQRPQPVELRVDHPFLFAIQHRESGTCLFLGHVTDPRLTYPAK